MEAREGDVSIGLERVCWDASPSGTDCGSAVELTRSVFGSGTRDGAGPLVDSGAGVEVGVRDGSVE